MLLAIGIVTLFLTAFMLAIYGYLGKHTERDVSFFMAVGIISIVMNLFTNAGGGGALWLSVGYLAIAVIFIALSFAVSVQGTVGFYKSVGSWCIKTFTNVSLIGWQILSFFLFPAGIALYFVWYKTKPELAEVCGKASMWGVLLWVVLLWTILGILL